MASPASVGARVGHWSGGEVLFEVFSRYYRASAIVTLNLPFEDWTGAFGYERLTGDLLDGLRHHVHILEMNGESIRLKQSKTKRRKTAKSAVADQPGAEPVDPATGEITTPP